MRYEFGEHLSMQHFLKNGDIISQQQFTALILQQEGIESLTLLTQSYMTPRGSDSSAVKIHRHLLKLANQGAVIHIGIDYNYSHLIAPHSDFPNKIAPFFMNRKELKEEQLKKSLLYKDLADQPNVELVFHGARRLRFPPFSKFDHRKVLLVTGSPIRDFAVIYGFNIDETLDHDIDSGVYITDPGALDWIREQQAKEEGSSPEKVAFDNFTFITREMARNGSKLVNGEVRSIVDGAKNNLIFCSQFLPDGFLLNGLACAADRGVDVSVISNGPSSSRQPMYMFARAVLQKKMTRICKSRENMSFYIPKSSSAFIHTKALIADINQPLHARGLTGTDNIANPMLGYLKTREILVELSNYDHIRNLYSYIRENVFPYVERVKF